MVEVLLPYVTDLDVRDERGRSALHYGATRGDNDVVRALLNATGKVRGDARLPDVNGRDSGGLTPLLVAVNHGEFADVVQTLLDHGADIEAQGAVRESRDLTVSPLIEAAAKGRHFHNARATWKAAASTFLYVQGRVKSVEILLKNVADIHRRGGRQISALMVGSACTCGSGLGCNSGNKAQIVKILLDKGADIHARNHNGWQPLHYAAMGGCDELVDILIDASANPLVPAKAGAPAEVADNSGHPALAKRLRDYEDQRIRAMLDDTDESTNSSVSSVDLAMGLKRAAFHGNSFLVSLLLDEGADPNERQPDNRTALVWSENGTSPLQMVQLLLPHMRAIDDIDSEGRSALHYAAMTGDAAVVRALLEAANSSRRAPDVNGLDIAGETPMFVAVYNGGSPDVVEALIEFGAHVNETNEGRLVPLHVAASRGRVGAVEVLLRHGADPNAVGGCNVAAETLLLLACGCTCSDGHHIELYRSLGFDRCDDRHSRMLELALSYGADVNAVGLLGVTALHVAAAGGCSDTVTRLLKALADPTIAGRFGDELTAAGRAFNEGHIFLGCHLKFHEYKTHLIRFFSSPWSVALVLCCVAVLLLANRRMRRRLLFAIRWLKEKPMDRLKESVEAGTQRLSKRDKNRLKKSRTRDEGEGTRMEASRPDTDAAESITHDAVDEKDATRATARPADADPAENETRCGEVVKRWQEKYSAAIRERDAAREALRQTESTLHAERDKGESDRQKVKSLSTSLQQAKQECTKAQKEAKQLSTKLEKQLEVANREKASKGETIAAAQRQAHTLTDEKDKMKARLDGTVKERDAAHKKIRDLEASVRELQADVGCLDSASIDRLSADRLEHTDQEGVRSFQSDIQEAMQQLASARDRLMGRLAGVSDQERQLRELEVQAKEKADDLQKCVVCMDEAQPATIVLSPCRHMCLCDKCWRKYRRRECPMCRKPFDRDRSGAVYMS
uniref:RING-type domain-containing protein n=1 Tax=Vitrella brassicaformis TaxID=1169539 RepID=A0A7S1KF91_9ALVE